MTFKFRMPESSNTFPILEFNQLIEDRVKFFDISHKDFDLENIGPSDCDPDCQICDQDQEQYHFLSVIDLEDGRIKKLSIPSTNLKSILARYQLQMERDRFIVSQKAQARRFRLSKMRYRK